MNNYLIAGLLAASTVLPLSANAASVGINGSSSLSGFDVGIVGGSDFLSASQISIGIASSVFGTGGTGDFSNLTIDVPTVGTSTGATNIVFDISNLTPSNWDISSSKFVFDVSNVVFVTQNANFLNVYTQGMFTPVALAGLGSQAGGCATGGNDCMATETSVRWSFTRSGSALSGYSVSASGTLNSPYAPLQVPEPATLGLFGIGLLGLAAARRRKAA